MSVFCTLFGHTWIPVTIAPSLRWQTTKDGHTLHQEEVRPGSIRHVDRCARCGIERDAGSRKLDSDRVDVAESPPRHKNT